MNHRCHTPGVARHDSGNASLRVVAASRPRGIRFCAAQITRGIPPSSHAFYAAAGVILADLRTGRNSGSLKRAPRHDCAAARVLFSRWNCTLAVSAP